MFISFILTFFLRCFIYGKGFGRSYPLFFLFFLISPLSLCGVGGGGAVIVNPVNISAHWPPLLLPSCRTRVMAKPRACLICCLILATLIGLALIYLCVAFLVAGRCAGFTRAAVAADSLLCSDIGR